MRVTGLPPSVTGIVIVPDVDVTTAGDDELPPPSDASPFETVYVHVMPLTVSVSAKAESDDMHITVNPITSFAHFAFIVSALSCFIFLIMEGFYTLLALPHPFHEVHSPNLDNV